MKRVSIIGSGLGGLVAGNLLAKKGHRVTIFESHRTPGGYTAGFWRKGFYFESGTLSFESSGMVFKAMKELGVYDQIPFVRQHSRWLSDKFDAITDSYPEFKTLILQAYPSEQANLTRYFAEVDKMYTAMADFITEKKSRLQALGSILIGGLKSALLYSRYAHVTVGDFTARFFNRDSELFRLFKNIGYPDMAAWILGGAIATIFTDYWTVANGMQAWTDVLVENFKKAGGELKLNAPVEQICTQNQTAIGVKSQNQFYEADYVISAADYKKTFLQLLDQPASLPAERLEKIRQTAVSEGIFTVYLGLNLAREQMQSLLKIPHVMYFDEKPGADVQNPNDRHFFEKTSVGLYSPSLMNPALAPAGKSSLMLQTIAPTNWMDNWGAGDRQRYRELKEMVKTTLIQKASVVIPNLHALIEFEDAATPLTYERYTQNTNGATSAWSWSPKNQFHKTFYRSYIETPIQNLLIGSCWATQIGGVPGAIGAALNCVKRIR